VTVWDHTELQASRPMHEDWQQRTICCVVQVMYLQDRVKKSLSVRQVESRFTETLSLNPKPNPNPKP